MNENGIARCHRIGERSGLVSLKGQYAADNESRVTRRMTNDVEPTTGGDGDVRVSFDTTEWWNLHECCVRWTGRSGRWLIDLLPWFMDENGQIFVLAKKDFPRPIINAQNQNKHLNRANYSGYLTEPISAIADLGLRNADWSEPTALASGLLANIQKILAERANLSNNEILEISEPNFYFPSAGGIDERVESFLVQIAPFEKPPQVIENYTPFTGAGVVRATGGGARSRVHGDHHGEPCPRGRAAGAWWCPRPHPVGAGALPDPRRLEAGR